MRSLCVLCSILSAGSAGRAVNARAAAPRYRSPIGSDWRADRERATRAGLSRCALHQLLDRNSEKTVFSPKVRWVRFLREARTPRAPGQAEPERPTRARSKTIPRVSALRSFDVPIERYRCDGTTPLPCLYLRTSGLRMYEYVHVDVLRARRSTPSLHRRSTVAPRRRSTVAPPSTRVSRVGSSRPRRRFRFIRPASSASGSSLTLRQLWHWTAVCSWLQLLPARLVQV